MKKALSLLLTILLFGTGIAFAEQKVAVIDVAAVYTQSAQVQALQKDQTKKMQNLEKWLKTAQADIEKQKTPEGKEKLLKKYNEEFAKKREAMAKDYSTKFQAIDKSITETIAAQAKAKGYDMVISKTAVVYGGDDITADVQKAIK